MKASQITAIDFFNDLSSRYARRRFFWPLAIFALICLGLNYIVVTFLSGTTKEFLAAVFLQLSSSAAIILLFYFLYYYFVGPNLNAHVRPVRPKDIQDSIKDLTKDTKTYCFWGRSGGYFRAEPLRQLSDIAEREKKVIDVEVLLPDPSDPQIVAEYVRIRKSLQEPNPEKNTLLLNVLATCICCAVLQENNKFLKVKVHWSRYLPTFRVDLSDKGAIVTQDDPAKYALFFEPKSEFYEMFHNAIRTEANLSRPLQWNGALFRNLKLDERCCNKDTLTAFGIHIESISEIQAEVASLIVKRTHRYI